MSTVARFARRTAWVFEAVRRDMGYAVRSLVRAPGLTITIVVTLGLGVGANAAVFSVLDRVLIRAPGGVRDPSTIRRIYAQNFSAALGWGPDGRVTASVRWRDLVDLAAAAHGRAEIVADHSRGGDLDIGAGSGGPPLYASFVSPGYFAFLGVHPQLGRFFGPDEDLLEQPVPVAVISDALWRGSFASDPRVIGRTLRLDGTRFTIVGVAPADFTGLDFMPRDIWLPLANAGRAFLEKQPVISVYARVLRRVNPRILEEQLTAQYRHTHDADPFVESKSRVFLGPLNKAFSDARGQSGVPERSLDLIVRLGGVGVLVCVLAVANVASLLLMRAVRRRREIAVRLALGITRARLLSQLAIESALLALGASTVALLVADLTGATLRFALASTAKWPDAVLDPRIVAFAIVAASTIAMMAGLAPVAFALRTNLASSLQSSGDIGGRTRARVFLLAGQSALCMALLACAGIFLQSLRHALTYDRGFDINPTIQVAIRFPSQVITITPTGVATDPGAGQQNALTDESRLVQIAARLRDVSGVVAVGETFSGLLGYGLATKIGPNAQDTIGVGARGPFLEFVEADFMRAAGLRIVDGRAFEPADEQAPTAVLNDGLAKALFRGRRAVGECVHVREPRSPCRVIVGVVRDVLADLSAVPAYRVYVPRAQAWTAPNTALVPHYFIVRMRGAASVKDAARLKDAILPLVPDASLATIDVQRTRDVLAPEVRPWRVTAMLFLGLGLLGLAAAVTGIYGLVAYEAAQRAREFGVRVALGASSSSIARLVIGSGLRVVVLGLSAGIVAALALGRVMTSLLFATSAYDPAVLVATAITLTLAAGIASVVPAWRAAQMDPAHALRTE